MKVIPDVRLSGPTLVHRRLGLVWVERASGTAVALWLPGWWPAAPASRLRG